MKRISFTAFGVVLAILVGAALLFIFMNSAEPADESAATSRNFGRFVLTLFMRGFSEFSEAEMAHEIAVHDHLIRKLAHMTEYAGLSFLVSLLLLQFTGMDRTLLRALVLSVVLCAAYAMTDEVHQLFVAGRSASLVDVLIDTGGAAVGALLAMAAHMIYTKIVKRR